MAAALNESNLCRLCSLETDQGVDIYKDEYSPVLEPIINRYLPLKVIDDGRFPKSVCPSCAASVASVSEFLEIIAAGQRRLRDLWKEQVARMKKFDDEAGNTDQQSPDFSSVYGADHPMTLALEGRTCPRRKPGRPRKQKPAQSPLEDRPLTAADNQEGEEAADPELALEQMFKEAEEKRQTQSDLSSRTRRRRKVPQRFEGAVQGKELEAIFKEEGVIGDEDDDEGSGEEPEAEDPVNEQGPCDQDSENHSDENDPDKVGDSQLDRQVSGSVKMTGRRSSANVSGNRSVGRPRKRRFICEYCGKTFLHSGHFEHHLKSRHKKSQFICLNCNDTFPSKEELLGHQQQTGHTEEGIIDADNTAEDDNADELSGQCLQVDYKCCSCDKVFGQQSALTGHIVEQHARPGINVCDLCGKTFSHPSSVIYHKEVAHSKGSSYVCLVCNKSFKHKQLLQRHSLVHSEDRPFVCHVCGATFKTRANLYNHNSVHAEEKRFSCEHCDAKFAHKTSLVLHTRWHTGEKPFACSVCGKTFSQAGNLQEHLRIHTGEKPFACQICSKRFTTSSQHRLHMKRHTGERPWKCEYCGKDFLHKDSWKCHLRRHRGEKPFTCPVCPRTFTEQWALKKHIRLHTGEKPYQCHVCSKSFSDLSNLQKHRKTHKTSGMNKVGGTIVEVPESEEGQLPTLSVDGQHIIYVTGTHESDQATQLLISAIAEEDGNLLPDPASVCLIDDGMDGQHVSVAGSSCDINQTPAADDDVLGMNAGESCSNDIEHQQQVVEFTTQDGRRVCLIIPSDVDPYEFTSQYLSNLS